MHNKPGEETHSFFVFFGKTSVIGVAAVKSLVDEINILILRSHFYARPFQFARVLLNTKAALTDKCAPLNGQC